MRHRNFAGQIIVPVMPMTAGGLVMMPAGSFEPPDDLPAIHVCIIHNVIAVTKPTSAEFLIQRWQGQGGGHTGPPLQGDWQGNGRAVREPPLRPPGPRRD